MFFASDFTLLKKPVIGMKISSTADISDRDVTIALKETITIYKIKVTSRVYRRIGISWDKVNGKKRNHEQWVNLMKEWVEGRPTHQSTFKKVHIILMFNEASIHTWTIHSLRVFSLSSLFTSPTSAFTSYLTPPSMYLPPLPPPPTTNPLLSIYPPLSLSLSFNISS